MRSGEREEKGRKELPKAYGYRLNGGSRPSAKKGWGGGGEGAFEDSTMNECHDAVLLVADHDVQSYSFVCFKGSGPPSDRPKLVVQLMTISPVLYGVMCAVTILCIILAVCFLAFNIKLRHYR